MNTNDINTNDASAEASGDISAEEVVFDFQDFNDALTNGINDIHTNDASTEASNDISASNANTDRANDASTPDIKISISDVSVNGTTGINTNDLSTNEASTEDCCTLASENISSPVVSICLPVYNGERYISMAINSALNQSAADFELLISDDNSTDRSWEIIQSYAEKDKRIRAWKNEKRLGLFENYNLCISASNGKYIKLFAQDDVFENNILKKMRKVLDENDQVALVACAKKFIDGSNSVISPDYEDGNRVCRAFLEDTEISADEAISTTIIQLLNWLGEPSTVMFRKVHAGAGFDTRYSQLGDLDYWYRILQFGNYFYISERLCEYRRHENTATVSNTFTLRSTVDLFLLISKYSKYIVEQGYSLTGLCCSWAEKSADWTRHLVENEFKDVFPEFFVEGTFDPNKPYQEGNDFLLLAYRLLAHHALVCISRNVEKADSYRNELEQQSENLERTKKWTMLMEQELQLLNSEIRQLKFENNKKKEEDLANRAENRRLRNQILNLQKKVQHLEKGRLEEVSELSYTKA